MWSSCGNLFRNRRRPVQPHHPRERVVWIKLDQNHPEAIIRQAAPRWKVLIGQVSTHCLAIEEPLGPILPECRAWKQKMLNVHVKLLECLKAIWRKVQRNRWPAGRQILEIHTFRAPQFVRHVTVLADKCTVKVCCHVVATEASRSIKYHTLMNRPESHSWASWVRGFDPSTESTHCLGFERLTVKTASAVFGALLTGIPNLFVAHLTPSARSMEILVRLMDIVFACSQHEQESFKKKHSFKVWSTSVWQKFCDLLE